MNCYFTYQKLSKFCKTCSTAATKETALGAFNLAHGYIHLSLVSYDDSGCLDDELQHYHVPCCSMDTTRYAHTHTYKQQYHNCSML